MTASRTQEVFPFHAASLVFIEDEQGKLLLLKRNKAPNKDLWSPIGGKVETDKGESPFECAARETFEEAGFRIATEDLHLFGLVTEKAYEECGHWFLFLFRCKRPIPTLPEACAEGHFAFFERKEIMDLCIPETDRQALWTLFDTYKDGFAVLKAHFQTGGRLVIEEEQILSPATLLNN